MHDDVYERLIDALDALPNGFPRTPNRIELRILKKLFSPEEAMLASRLTRHLASVDTIVPAGVLTPKAARDRLIAMAKRGLLWFEKRGKEFYFRLAPFIVGIYEAQRDNLDHELAHLFEEYMCQGGAAGIMKPQPALHRVVPAAGSIRHEWILPYDDVRAIMMTGKVFGVSDCICRLQQDRLNKRRCRHALKNCLYFSRTERAPKPEDITRDQAFAILAETEAAGLVHTVSNVVEGVFYVCNCCGCCCGILRGITDWGIENSVARANYYSTHDPALCTICEVCLNRCQVRAIRLQDGKMVFDRARCIGCGLCVASCPTAAIKLIRKPDARLIHPPQDFCAWEETRLRNRRRT